VLYFCLIALYSMFLILGVVCYIWSSKYLSSMFHLCFVILMFSDSPVSPTVHSLHSRRMLYMDSFDSCIFNLLSLFWRTKKRLMRSPCCLWTLPIPKGLGKLLLAIASTVILGCESHGIHDCILLSYSSHSNFWKPEIRLFI
jgi:hypothetical protein